jgi:hypothetical protein
MQPRPFTLFVRAALAMTPISDLLAKSEAIILERIAMGGGATRWYYCPDRLQLDAVEIQFRPGSAVSFYFDGRIQNALYSPELKPNLEKIIVETGDLVFGLLNKDGFHLDVDFLCGPQELAEVTSTLDSKVRIFYGAFPARDNDGIRAVTLVLPDADGIVRPHPY